MEIDLSGLERSMLCTAVLARIEDINEGDLDSGTKEDLTVKYKKILLKLRGGTNGSNN